MRMPRGRTEDTDGESKADTDGDIRQTSFMMTWRQS